MCLALFPKLQITFTSLKGKELTSAEYLLHARSCAICLTRVSTPAPYNTLVHKRKPEIHEQSHWYCKIKNKVGLNSNATIVRETFRAKCFYGISYYGTVQRLKGRIRLDTWIILIQILLGKVKEVVIISS